MRSRPYNRSVVELVACCICLSAAIGTIGIARAGAPELTKEYLLKNKWSSIVFSADNTFIRALPGSIDAISYVGTYEVKKGQLYLSKSKSEEICETMPATSGKLILRKNILDYSVGLRLADGLVVMNLNSKVKDGTPIEIDSVACIRIGDADQTASGTARADLILRAKPRVKAARLSYHEILPENDDDPEFVYVSVQSPSEQRKMAKSGAIKTKVRKAIPKDASFQVFARTAKKAKLKGVEDYWYYIYPSTDLALDEKCWVFGKDVELER